MVLSLWGASLLVGVVLLNLSLPQAAKERMHVSQGGVQFNVIRFDERRNKPFNLIFKVEGEKSNFKFNAAGDVTDIKVGDIKYGVGSTSPPDVTLSTNQSLGSTRRVLTENGEATEQLYDEVSVVEHRRLYACDDCEGTWDVMCGRGLTSVCDLVDYGPPLEASAEASISTLCGDFGDACSRLTATLACEGQCQNEDDTATPTAAGGACDPNPCNAGTCTVDPAGGHVCSCPGGFGGMSCQTDTSNLDRFYIEIDYNGTWTEAQEQMIRSQADRWEQVITHVPCGGTTYPGLELEGVPAGRLLIVANQYSVDGVGGKLGKGGPEYVWNDCPGISFAGAMTFDADDLAELNELGLGLLYLHEIAHVIGFGLNWEACSTCEEDSDPEWTCPAAAAVYNDLLGATPGTAANIVEVEGGSGTRCGHWSEDIVNDEVMTGTGEFGRPEPLSKLTVASLEDIGYIVDPSMVERYTLPEHRDVPMRLSASNAKTNPDGAFDFKKHYVDKEGNVVKEKRMIHASLRF